MGRAARSALEPTHPLERPFTDPGKAEVTYAAAAAFLGAPELYVAPAGDELTQVAKPDKKLQEKIKSARKYRRLKMKAALEDKCQDSAYSFVDELLFFVVHACLAPITAVPCLAADGARGRRSAAPPSPVSTPRVRVHAVRRCTGGPSDVHPLSAGQAAGS